MARIQNSFIGKASGSAGKTTFYTSFGVNMMRGKTFEYRDNPSPQTITIRGKFGHIGILLHRLLNPISVNYYLPISLFSYTLPALKKQLFAAPIYSSNPYILYFSKVPVLGSNFNNFFNATNVFFNIFGLIIWHDGSHFKVKSQVDRIIFLIINHSSNLVYITSTEDNLEDSTIGLIFGQSYAPGELISVYISYSLSRSFTFSNFAQFKLLYSNLH